MSIEDMNTAEEKRRAHVVEYILYVWQMEDLARAINFDLSQLRAHLQAAYGGDRLESELTWFGDLITKMKAEKLEKSGHISELNELMMELVVLHRTLLEVTKDADYKRAYESASPHLTEMERRGAPGRSEVEGVLTALYGWLMLRLKGTELGPETQASLVAIRDMANALAGGYEKMKAGAL
jgi:hypothetical protein